MFTRVIEEPPIRLLSYFLIKRFAKDIEIVNRWGAVERPNYFLGVLAAAKLAKADGLSKISVIEFGVAGGSGLVRLQAYAEQIEQQIGINIRVFGFDTGIGLPEPVNDYREHPDQWREGDYVMDVPKLKARLTDRTTLILGKISDTVPEFTTNDHPPIGFISCDVDLYSSTKDMLAIFSGGQRKNLRRVFMYFDDVNFVFNHRFAGELLAIDEFNQEHQHVKIDVWRGVRRRRVFQDEPWLDNMFIAHDLEAISNYVSDRAPSDDCALA
jgi:hypothetical protein